MSQLGWRIVVTLYALVKHGIGLTVVVCFASWSLAVSRAKRDLNESAESVDWIGRCSSFLSSRHLQERSIPPHRQVDGCPMCSGQGQYAASLQCCPYGLALKQLSFLKLRASLVCFHMSRFLELYRGMLILRFMFTFQLLLFCAA